MKKYATNLITIILLIFTSSNFMFAEKIVCKLEKNFTNVCIVDLVLCNNDGIILNGIDTIVLKLDELNDNQKYVLDLMDGIEINDQERWYKQIMNLKDQLENVKQNQLQPDYVQQAVLYLRSEIFKILGCKLYELGHDI